VSIDVTHLVTGVIPQRELGTLAPNRHTRDVPGTGNVMAGEDERRLDAAVVQPAVAERLVQVQIDSTGVAVMQYEVPGPVAGPRMDPIESLVDEGHEEALGLSRVDPDVEIRMLSSLPAQQRVDGPTSADTDRDPARIERRQQRPR
jgi:hypothetical protein